jgi:hypothetical protein
MRELATLRVAKKFCISLFKKGAFLLSAGGLPAK